MKLKQKKVKEGLGGALKDKEVDRGRSMYKGIQMWVSCWYVTMTRGTLIES